MSSQHQDSSQKQPNLEETGKNFVPPIMTSAIKLLLKVDPNHPLVVEYQKKREEYDKNFIEFAASLKPKEKEQLPDLKPIDIESLYKSFKAAYNIFRGIEFNESLNKQSGWKFGEGAVFARTICAYILNHKSFFKSPLLNNELNEPSFDKGLLIVGKMGTGKTSIIKTFYDMFVASNTYPLKVQDIEGTWQYLNRYKLGFKFFTSHEVLQDYHASCRDKNKEHEEIFWKKHTRGNSYYDDLMTEKKAFGRDELFTEVLETKYNKELKCWISMNYVGKENEELQYVEDIETTLDAFELKYGSRLYDRIFEMFNIIELKGKSLRK